MSASIGALMAVLSLKVMIIENTQHSTIELWDLFANITFALTLKIIVFIIRLIR